MYNDYFDFPEPSTGDIIFEELKRVLLGTLKEEIKSELERLKKENAELRPFKEDRDRMQRELRTVRADCERRIEAAERNAKDLAFEELFNEHLVEAWKVGRKVIKPPKCDKCDNARKIHFTSPRGKDMTEPCDCDSSTIVFEPVPALLTRFEIKPKAKIKHQQSDDLFYDKPVFYWYAPKHETTLGEDCEFVLTDWSDVGVRRPSELKDFKDCSEWYSVFTSRERCQEFCDYLAKMEAEKAV